MCESGLIFERAVIKNTWRSRVKFPANQCSPLHEKKKRIPGNRDMVDAWSGGHSVRRIVVKGLMRWVDRLRWCSWEPNLSGVLGVFGYNPLHLGPLICGNPEHDLDVSLDWSPVRDDAPLLDERVSNSVKLTRERLY